MNVWLRRIAQLVATALVTVFIARQLGVQTGDLVALGAEWWRPNPGLLLASSVLLVSVNLLTGLIWARVVRDLGGPQLEAPVAIRVFLVANLGRYVPGTVWQIAGLVTLARRHGVPAGPATSAAALGHLLSLAAATLVGAFVFSSTTLGSVDGSWLPIGVAALLAVAMTPPVLRAFARLYARLARLSEPPELSPRTVISWLGMFVAAWIGYGSAFLLLARSYGIDGMALSIGPAFVAAYVLGYVALFAPAGIGVREVALIALLDPVTGTAAALGLAVVARLWITVLEVIPGLAMAGRELYAPARGVIEP